MSAPYLPLDVMETMTRERQSDPRILAAQGSAATIRATRRQRLGRAIVRFGRWLEDQCPEAVTAPPAALGGTPGRA